ncbi:MAG: glycosyltransferase family 2 protein [Bdellovibrionaceae bacterium]|nr:glycosyltransferase family 2 protein [Bdellovibrio sp.]
MLKKSSFALVIPCYNEEKVIPFFAHELSSFKTAFSAAFPSTDVVVVIVDNNSNDQSTQLLQQFFSGVDYVKLAACAKQGYGAALKFGFGAVTADYYAFADLDNTYPLSDLIPMYDIAIKKNIEIISGGRLNSLSRIPWTRKIGNLFYSKTTRLIFKSVIEDTCSGMRIFNHHVLKEILSLKQNDLSFSIELTAHALCKKWSMYEYPITYRDRMGSSKLLVYKDGFKFLYILVMKRLFS